MGRPLPFREGSLLCVGSLGLGAGTKDRYPFAGSFCADFKQDIQAVESAVSTPWSNGPPAQREESSPEDICAVLAAVMAHGCDLGVYTMAQLNTRRPARQRLGTGSCRI
jgi:hypothetical protein